MDGSANTMPAKKGELYILIANKYRHIDCNC
jgi:hypothetical protein